MKPSIEQFETAPSWGSKLGGIDGLRGVAALSVASGHAIILLVAPRHDSAILGQLTGLLLHGLTLFFVISGFLLYRPFVTAVLTGRRRPTTRGFLVNRILRIWPAYLVILFFVGFVLGTTVTGGHGPGEIGGSEADFGRLTDPVILMTNVLLLQGFFPHTFLTGLGVSWSLVTEISFYALLPLAGLLAAVLARRMPSAVSVLVPAVLLFVVGATGRLIAIRAAQGRSPDEVIHLRTEATWSAVIYRSILTQGDLFALGMLAAVVLLLARRGSARQRSVVRRGAWALLAVSGGYVLLRGNTDWTTPAMGTLFATGILLISLPDRDPLARLALRVFDWRALRAAGLISYSLYLWHFPLIWFVRIHNDPVTHGSSGRLIGQVIGVLVLSSCLAAVTYRYVELPAMRRKVRTGVEETP